MRGTGLTKEKSRFVQSGNGRPIFQRNTEKLKTAVLPILFPVRCLICGKILQENQELTDRAHRSCMQKLTPIAGPCCLQCGRPLGHEGGLCLVCENSRKYGAGSYFERHVSVWQYTAGLRRSLYQFKYHNKREYADFYAREALRSYGALLTAWSVEAVIPVPLYKSRYRQRGYNQAELFARPLAAALELQLDTGLLKRVKKTTPQKNLGAEIRFQNLKDAFSTQGKICPYKKILLTDDIYTTGSTLNAAAAVLKQAGAQHVYCLTISMGI